MNGEPRPLLLAGPTAVGKTEIALRLAEKLQGEIVSVDSMQVYRGLDIGTAKPTAAERARVPHHLIDVVAVNEPFDVARYIQLASAAIRDIQARRAIPILCGGTGLYFKGLLEGIGHAPRSDPALREELEKMPMNKLLKELQHADPLTYERIDRQNPRRVIRAIEVIRLTGKRFSNQRSTWTGKTPLPFFCLTRGSADLHTRIDARVDDMFKRGLIEETRRAMEEGLENNRSAMQAIGYRQVIDHLRGKISLEGTIDLVKIRTRQYAKRQMTWFRRQPVSNWIPLSPATQAQSVAEDLAVAYRTHSARKPLGV
jgi:tRNA dimethylallyltransferase